MIELVNCSFRYSGSKIVNLDGISLLIKKGECILLTGKSGCGKTTLLRLVNGLIPHFYEGTLEGKLSIDGTEASQLTPAALSTLVASVFQNPRSQFFNTDTTSEMAFGCENLGLPREEIISRIDESVKILGIEHLRDRDIFILSGGEKQLVAIAGVYAMGPEIFVFDEPSANLDTSSVSKLAEVIWRLKSLGKTILIAEHRLAYLNGLADRILYLDRGRLTHSWNVQEFSGPSIPSGLSDNDLKERHPFSLSGGEKQRLSVAVAMARKAEIIILDEPTSGLDYANMQRVKDAILHLKERGTTVLVITHDYEFLLAVCNKAFYIGDRNPPCCRPLDDQTMKELQKFFVNKGVLLP